MLRWLTIFIPREKTKAQITNSKQNRKHNIQNANGFVPLSFGFCALLVICSRRFVFFYLVNPLKNNHRHRSILGTKTARRNVREIEMAESMLTKTPMPSVSANPRTTLVPSQ